MELCFIARVSSLYYNALYSPGVEFLHLSGEVWKLLHNINM